MNVCLWQMLADLAGAQPDTPAIITPDRVLTRADVANGVSGLACWLLSNGLDPAEVTGVALPDEVEHVLVTLALMTLGAASINLPTHETMARRSTVAATLGVTTLVCNDPALALPDIHSLCPPDLASLNASAGTIALLSATTMAADRIALYRTTSGTTGTPKTLGLRMALVMGAVGRIARAESERCVLRASSVEHDSSRIYRLTGLIAGRQAAFLADLRMATLGSFCVRAGVTEIQIGTYQLAALLSAPPSPADALPPGTRILTGGSRVAGPLRAAVQARLTRDLWISYATSETGVIAFAAPGDHAAFPEGVGYPIPGVTVSLRNAEGTEVAPGAEGTAWVRKPGVQTDAAGQPGWVCTGDLLSWPAGGPLVFHGRRDDMMILNGINIFPGPIEDLLEAHPAVAEAVAFPLPSAVHGQIPVAAVVLRPGTTAEAADLLRFARAGLGLQAPRQIRIVAKIPRTAVGKPLRRILAEDQ